MLPEHWSRHVGLLLVLAMHGAALYGLWSYRLLPAPEAAMTLFVNFVHPPPPVQKQLEPPPLPKKVKLVKQVEMQTPPQPVLAASAPVVAPTEPVALPSPSEPVPVVEALPGPLAPEPVVVAPPPAPLTLTSDLAVGCPQRVPPEYPAVSRRINEQGLVVLRVELDETGAVVSAKVKESSGFKRLDEAGIAAVRQWRCNVPLRNGEPVRAVAMQPFNFVLEGRR